MNSLSIVLLIVFCTLIVVYLILNTYNHIDKMNKDLIKPNNTKLSDDIKFMIFNVKINNEQVKIITFNDLINLNNNCSKEEIIEFYKNSNIKVDENSKFIYLDIIKTDKSQEELLSYKNYIDNKDTNIFFNLIQYMPEYLFLGKKTNEFINIEYKPDNLDHNIRITLILNDSEYIYKISFENKFILINRD